MPFQFTCVRCGAEFTRPARQTPLKQPYKYCSVRCLHPLRELVSQDDGAFLVPLSKPNKFAVIDAEDAEYVGQFNWTYRARRGCEYAIRAVTNGSPRNVFLHVELMRPPDGFEVDHIDGNGLNNRRRNLRTVTHAENCRNSRGRHVSTSGYKGVSLNASGGSWHARIHTNGKTINLGYYRTPEEAARAYDNAAKELWGEFAWLNFPHDHTP